MMSLSTRVYNLLQHTWSYQRVITQYNSIPTQTIHSNGTAVWSKRDGDELLYREDGLISSSNCDQPITTYQQYIYQIQQNTINIYFFNNDKQNSNNALFHSLQLSSTNDSIITGESHHKCIQDDYNGTYTFDTRDHTIYIRYNVKGPNKDYISDTTFNLRTT